MCVKVAFNSVLAGILCASVASAADVAFKKITLTERYYCDGITSGDINSDGHVDVVAGPFWYAGPDFRDAYEIYEPVPLIPEASPSNSMFSFVHDFNGDGRPDVLVLGRVHKHEAKWYENPGNTTDLWQSHFVFERIRGESPVLTGITSDKSAQLMCHWQGRWGWVEPDSDNPESPWQFVAIGEGLDWPQFYHGQGVGDLNGDGRPDLILNDGWYEQPPDPGQRPLWKFHRGRFSTGRGGAQMFTDDVDGDGKTDVISAVDAHGWGLAWYQNQSTAGFQFKEHLIMGDHTQERELGAAFTQPHALAYADIDADGRKDIITGKRMWAHGPDGDIEPNADPVVYWFRNTKQADGTIRFVPHQVDDRSGVGVQIAVADLNDDGRLDILTASKLGCFVFLNKSRAE